MKTNTHIVIKKEDADKYCSAEELFQLKRILKVIEHGRQLDGKTLSNSYYICNTDEPYADKVLDVILTGEVNKNTTEEVVS